MKRMTTGEHHAGKAMVLFLWGAALYMAVEILWRGYTHWTMGVLGGVLFLLIGHMNEHVPWSVPLIWQGVAGAVLVTAAEFAAGCILNIWLHLGIWDYSGMPFALLGQICLPYSLLWIALSILAVIIDDYLRYWLFDEEKPHYTIFRRGSK